MKLEKYRKLAAFETLPRKNWNKVFCIGFNKTGTTSMENIFWALGYNMPNQTEQELRLVRQLDCGNFRPLVEHCAQHDVFQDAPFSTGVVYAQVDCLFPGSKFILTVRESNAWFDSLVRFHLSGMLKKQGVNDISEVTEATFKDKAVYLYENYVHQTMKRLVSTTHAYQTKHEWSLLYDREHFVQVYERRNEQIINYFQDRPDDLLIIDVSQEADISKILDFLDLPASLNREMPHANASAPDGRRGSSK